VALLQALAVGDDGAYQAVVTDWSARTQTWTTGHPDQANVTIIFRLWDEGGRPIDDSLILIQDQQGNANNVSSSLQPHQPIQNAANPSSVSFYLNYARFMATRPHIVHIEARSGSPWIDYRDLDYKVADPLLALVRPNEFTYVDIQLPRDVSRTYAVVGYDPGRNVNATWPPLPQ
jgi:hypothetical protein